MSLPIVDLPEPCTHGLTKAEREAGWTACDECQRKRLEDAIVRADGARQRLEKDE